MYPPCSHSNSWTLFSLLVDVVVVGGGGGIVVVVAMVVLFCFVLGSDTVHLLLSNCC